VQVRASQFPVTLDGMNLLVGRDQSDDVGRNVIARYRGEPGGERRALAALPLPPGDPESHADQPDGSAQQGRSLSGMAIASAQIATTRARTTSQIWRLPRGGHRVACVTRCTIRALENPSRMEEA